MRNPPPKAGARRPTSAPGDLAAMEAELALKQAVKLRDAGRIDEALRQCAAILRADPRHAGSLYLMGTLAHQLGAMDMAIESLEQAAANAPKTPAMFVALGNALAAARRHEAALKAFRRAIALKPDSVSAHRGMGQVQLDLGLTADALRSFRRALALRPDDLQSAYFVAALGEGGANGGTTGYVPALFDSYAGQFDAHLARLGYRVPELIADRLGGQQFDSALDIGCGTGLVGMALRERVTAMDGLDVSAQMIAKTAERGIYRHLAAGDAVALLGSDARFGGPYDLVTAADVFIYVGRLEAMFAAVMARLAQDGLFVFSVEVAPTGDVTIQGSGRFAHSAGYIAALAAEHGLVSADETALDLRQEFGATIPGMLYVLRRMG